MSLQYQDPTLLEQAQQAGVTIVPGELPRDRELVANGLRLHYLDWGNGGAPVILFLHGGAQTAHMWDFAALAIRDRFHCIALDQRGHGDTQWAPDGDYSLSAHQQDIEAFVTNTHIAPLAVVGLSMGGRNAYVFAANHPEWVQRLVIVDTGPEGRAEGRNEISAFMQLPDELDSYEEFVTRVHSYSPLRPIEQVRTSLKHNVKQMPNGKWTWKYDRLMRQPALRQPAATNQPASEYLWACVAKIECPTLLVRGGESPVFPSAVAERMTKVMRNCSMVTVPRAGHRVPGDNPRAFEQALTAFLSRS